MVIKESRRRRTWSVAEMKVALLEFWRVIQLQVSSFKLQALCCGYDVVNSQEFFKFQFCRPFHLNAAVRNWSLMMEPSASRNLSKLSSMTEASSFILIEGVHWKYILSGIGGVCRVCVQPEWPCHKDWVIVALICTNKLPLLVWREGVFDNERKNGLFYDFNCSTTWLRMMWILNNVFNMAITWMWICQWFLSFVVVRFWSQAIGMFML